MNPYLEEESVSVSDWPEIANWSVIISSQVTEDTIPDMEFGTIQCA